MRDEITDCYVTPNPVRVARLLAEEGMEVCLDMWGYSQTVDGIYDLAQEGRIMLGEAPPPERNDADDIISAGLRLGSAYYAARELGIPETAARDAFKRRGMDVPKLDKDARKDALLTKAIARRTVKAAGPKGYAITVRKGQLAWEFV